MPIEKGGTNATDATTARTNLGAASIDNPTFTGSMSMGRTNGSVVGKNSVALGEDVTASGKYTTAIGYSNSATGDYAVTIGGSNEAINHSVGIGYYAKATGDSSVAIGGYAPTASGNQSISLGFCNKSSGDYSMAVGCESTADNDSSFSCGKYNKPMATGADVNTNVGDVFVIGNGAGYEEKASNCFRVTYTGQVYGLSSFKSSGADYAEYFEWLDQNSDNEDRVGRFVTLKGKNIQIATPTDYILGVVSGTPCIIGNADEDWLGRWQHDDFGRFTLEYCEITEEEVSTEGMTEEEMLELYRNPEYKHKNDKWYRTITTIVDYPTSHYRYKANPDYDYTQQYIERQDRPEWDAVGMLGVLSVRDDGTCVVDGFCKVADGGIATNAEEYVAGKTYRVIERVSANVVKVVFK